MDKLKPIFVAIKKYHVWVLCVAIVGVAVGGLFAGTGGLQKDAKETEGKVKGINSKVQGLLLGDPPKNQAWIDAKDKEISEDGERTSKIQSDIYDSQQSELV